MKVLKQISQTKIMENGSVIKSDGSLITKNRMQEISKELKNVNRIHKPFVLIEWQNLKHKFK